MLLDTVASSTGWGVVLDQHAGARSSHVVDRNGLHINLLELGAITRALQSFADVIPMGAIFRLRTDLMVTLGVIHAGSSRSPALMVEMRDLHEQCERVGVELRVEHVSSVLNEWAERLSRENDSIDWTFGASAFHRLDAAFGPHMVDFFASTDNTRCERIYSRWRSPDALGVNAMAFDWSSENAWANPPFHLIGAVINRLLTTGGAATLIVLHWTAQPWWHRAVERMPVLAPAAVGGRVLHARLEVAADDAAVLADCGLPLRGPPALRNDTHRWDRLLSRAVGSLAADWPDSTVATNRLLHGYRPITRRSYMSKCRAFFAYCAVHHREPLPSTVAAIIG